MFLPDHVSSDWNNKSRHCQHIVRPWSSASLTYEVNLWPALQGSLSHPELLVAVEMLSSVVLMNQAMDVGDRAALWRQLSSSVAGLSNVEDEYAQR